jgi:hypothetical protein
MSPSTNNRGRKETVLRGAKRRYQVKKLDSSIIRISRNRVSTVYWPGKLDFTSYIHFDGRCPRTGYYYLSNKKFTNYLAITSVSASVFGTGLGTLIYYFFWK